MKKPQATQQPIRPILPILFLFLLPPGLFADDPTWTDRLLDRVSEIDEHFYGAAAERLDLWTGQEAPPATGEAYGPGDIYEHARLANRELALLNVERNKMLIEKRGAEANRFPTLDLEASLTNIANPLDPITLTAGELGVYSYAGEEILIPPEDLTIWEGMESSLYNFTLKVDQPVFTWGKIKGAVEAATIAAEAGQVRIESKEREIRSKIYGLMYALYYIDKIEEILDLQEASTARLVQITEDSYENGFILYSELLDARIKAKELEIAKVRLETEKSNILIDLTYTSGIENLTEDDLDFTSLEIAPESVTLGERDDLIRKSLAENPNLKLLDLVRRIQTLRQRITEGDNYFKPDIGLHFELSYGGSRFPFIETDWFGTDRWNLTSTLGVSTTVFDGGKLMSSILKEAQASEAAMYDYQKGAETITRTISETLLKLELSLRNLEYYHLKSENGQVQLELKQTQYESGAGSETDYLMRKIELYTDIIEYYRECITFYSNLYTLEALTGPME